MMLKIYIKKSEALCHFFLHRFYHSLPPDMVRGARVSLQPDCLRSRPSGLLACPCVAATRTTAPSLGASHTWLLPGTESRVCFSEGQFWPTELAIVTLWRHNLYNIQSYEEEKERAMVTCHMSLRIKCCSQRCLASPARAPLRSLRGSLWDQSWPWAGYKL